MKNKKTLIAALVAVVVIVLVVLWATGVFGGNKPEEVAEKVEEKVEEKVDEAKDAVEGDVDDAKEAVEGAVDGIWPESPWYGSDEAGFGALPGGVRYTYGGFVGIGLVVDYWTSRPKGTTYAYGKGLRYNSDVVSIVLDYPNNAHYVRLVKDY